MTIYVPLAADMDGTLSAIALGDWLLQIIKVKRPQETQLFYNKLISNFKPNEETKEQEIKDHTDLFYLLLSQEELVFECLREALTKGEVVVIVAAQDSANSDNSKEKEVRKEGSELFREAEEMFRVLMSMIALRIYDTAAAAKAVGRLVEVFTKATDMPEFRLKLLQALYNAFPPSFPYRYQIFFATLKHAASCEKFHIFLPYIENIDSWMADWKLTRGARRDLFLLLSEELKKLNKCEAAYEFLKRHIAEYEDESAEVVATEAATEAAAKLACESVRLPGILFFDDIIQMRAIAQLGKTKHANLLQLLDIYVTGTPQEFLKFHKNNESIFKAWDLDFEACLNKVRLLTLSSRCVGQTELTLSELAAALGMDSKEEVEEIVVQAVGHGLINAKVDQLIEAVHVKYSTRRQFTNDEWALLAKKLEQWTGNVSLLRNMIAQAKVTATSDGVQPTH